MRIPSFFLLCFILFVVPYTASAQKGSIFGKVYDKQTGETLVGVNVVITGSSQGAATDLDGRYQIRNLSAGVYSLTVSYVSYVSQSIKDINLKEGQAVQVNIALVQNVSQLQVVEISAAANRQNVQTLLMEIKNAASVSDGISQDIIKRTPDKNTGEVLKRISGTTVQDNKFVIVRGLNDRYNYPVINGIPFSTTEPDRKAVSFDIFPAQMIDNIMVIKTATPDKPGEFAGGLIQINTRDIPEENSFSIAAGGGYNTQVTFKNFAHGPKGGTDWLGYDDGTRSLPDFVPAPDSIAGLTLDDRVALSRKFTNDWKTYRKSGAAPNYSMQATWVRNFRLLGKETGLLAGATYNNSKKLKVYERNNYESRDTAATAQVFNYNDSAFTSQVTTGGILNFTSKLNGLNKITWRNLFSRNAEDKTLFRYGIARKENQLVRSTSIEYGETLLLLSQLQGDHLFETGGARLQWGFSASRLQKHNPDTRKMRYSTRELSDPEVDSTQFFAYVPYVASPYYAGKLFQRLQEDVYNESLDLMVPLKFMNAKHEFKTGGSLQQKFRNYNARALGYKVASPLTFNNDLLLLPLDSLFDTQNMSDSGFVIDDITNPYDKYYADVHLSCVYAMLTNHLFEKIKLIWGVRYENFHQRLYTRDNSNKKSSVNRTEPDWLPSVNIVWSPTEKINVRWAASRTVARPEFREISNLNVFDFVTESSLAGNDSLVRTRINNYDTRFEFYPSSGQVISVSGFYKKFSNPIEQTVSYQGNKTYSYQNVLGAVNYGVEFELRLKPVSFFGGYEGNRLLRGLTLFSNVAWIHSEVNLANVINAGDSVRALQGQSPYVINAGVQWFDESSGTAVSVLVNKIGDRIDKVGDRGYFDIMEASKPLLDFQVAKKVFKQGELKFTVSDVLNKKHIFYWDVNRDKKFDDFSDKIIEASKGGTSFSLSLAYRF